MNPLTLIVERLLAAGHLDLASQVANFQDAAAILTDLWGEDTDIISAVLAETVPIVAVDVALSGRDGAFWAALRSAAPRLSRAFAGGAAEVTLGDLCFMTTLSGWPPLTWASTRKLIL